MKVSYISAALLAFTLIVSACTSNTTQTEMPDESDDVTSIQIDNMGSTAYVILGIDGEGASANLNEENADLTLRVGDRFRFENVAGASNHPLDFRNSDRDKLLGQSNADGLLDDDSDVNVVIDGNILSFTHTEEVADELKGYVYLFHPSMNGTITTTDI